MAPAAAQPPPPAGPLTPPRPASGLWEAESTVNEEAFLTACGVNLVQRKLARVPAADTTGHGVGVYSAASTRAAAAAPILAEGWPR